MITLDFQLHLYDYIGGILRSQDGRLLAAGGMSDHIHLLAAISKQVAIADSLRDIKANSSKWVHETFPDKRDFAWQAGYGAFTVSRSNVAAVTDYIARQAEHHRTTTFQQEFIAFLNRHEIEYDERYIWA